MPPSTPASTPARFRRPAWNTRDVAGAAVIAVAIFVAFRFLWAVRLLAFVAFLGTLFGLALSAGTDRLERWRIPRGLGATLVMLAVLAALAGFGLWTGPTVRTQYRELQEKLPEALGRLDVWLNARPGLTGTLIGAALRTTDTDSTPRNPTSTGQPATDSAPISPPSGETVDATIKPSSVQTGDSVRGSGSVGAAILSGVGGARRYVVPVITVTIETITALVLIVFLAIYIAADPGLYRRGVLELVPHRSRIRMGQLLSALTSGLRRWLLIQLIAMVVMGIVTTIALLTMHVRAALPLGILAGLLTFIPTFGAIIASVPAIAMGLLDSPQKAVTVAVVYFIIHFLSSKLLVPVLMKEGVDLPPALTILAEAAMALVFGFIGLFVAVPLLVVAMITVKMLYVEDVIGQPTALPYTREPAPRVEDDRHDASTG